MFLYHHGRLAPEKDETKYCSREKKVFSVAVTMSFLQNVFNDISLRRDQALWMSADDARTDDRLRLVAKFPEARFDQVLSVEKGAALRICSKNEKLAAALREKGNLAYAQGDTASALHLYNQCLQYSEPGPELAIAFANRSAVWLELKKWSRVLADIDSALAFDYPGNKRHKLLERQALCLYSMGRRPEADAVVDAVLAEVPGMKKGQQARVRSKMEQLKSSGKRMQPEKEPASRARSDIALGEPHELYPRSVSVACFHVTPAMPISNYCLPLAFRPPSRWTLPRAEAAFAWPRGTSRWAS